MQARIAQASELVNNASAAAAGGHSAHGSHPRSHATGPDASAVEMTHRSESYPPLMKLDQSAYGSVSSPCTQCLPEYAALNVSCTSTSQLRPVIVIHAGAASKGGLSIETSCLAWQVTWGRAVPQASALCAASRLCAAGQIKFESVGERGCGFIIVSIYSGSSGSGVGQPAGCHISAQKECCTSAVVIS